MCIYIYIYIIYLFLQALLRASKSLEKGAHGTLVGMSGGFAVQQFRVSGLRHLGFRFQGFGVWVSASESSVYGEHASEVLSLGKAGTSRMQAFPPFAEAS